MNAMSGYRQNALAVRRGDFTQQDLKDLRDMHTGNSDDFWTIHRWITVTGSAAWLGLSLAGGIAFPWEALPELILRSALFLVAAIALGLSYRAWSSPLRRAKRDAKILNKAAAEIEKWERMIGKK